MSSCVIATSVKRWRAPRPSAVLKATASGSCQGGTPRLTHFTAKLTRQALSEVKREMSTSAGTPDG